MADATETDDGGTETTRETEETSTAAASASAASGSTPPAAAAAAAAADQSPAEELRRQQRREAAIAAALAAGKPLARSKKGYKRQRLSKSEHRALKAQRRDKFSKAAWHDAYERCAVALTRLGEEPLDYSTLNLYPLSSPLFASSRPPRFFRLDEAEVARRRATFAGSESEFDLALAKDMVERAMAELQGGQQAAGGAAAEADEADEADEGAGGQAACWDDIYAVQQERIYKARQWLREDFAPLAPDAPPPRTILEVGCGTGSSVLPLLAAFPEATVLACDFSATAVRVLRELPAVVAAGPRVRAFVCDLCTEHLCMPASASGASAGAGAGVAAGSVDVAMALYVFSAMLPEDMGRAAANLFQALRPGGQVCFRDYGRYDMTQLRFLCKEGRRLREHLYARGDGTRTYYFEPDETATLFRGAGFEVLECRWLTAAVPNLKMDIVMRRIFVQAVLRRPSE